MSAWERLGLALLVGSCLALAIIYSSGGLVLQVKYSCGGGRFEYDHTPVLVAIVLSGVFGVWATFLTFAHSRRLLIKGMVFFCAGLAPYVAGVFCTPTETVLAAPSPRAEPFDSIQF